MVKTQYRLNLFPFFLPRQNIKFCFMSCMKMHENSLQMERKKVYKWFYLPEFEDSYHRGFMDTIKDSQACLVLSNGLDFCSMLSET